MDASEYRVVVGEYDLSKDDGSEQVVKVDKIIVHPGWTGDIAEG